MESWFTVALVFVIVWWPLFFMALPVGVRHDHKDEHAEASGAPRNPRLWVKAAATSVIAAALTYGIDVLIRSDLLNGLVR